MAEAKGSRSKKHIRLEKPRQDVLAEPEEKKKRRRGGVIRRRWMTNTLAATFAIVAVAVSVFAVAMNNYYTSTIMATLESRAQTVADMFQDYTESYYRSTARDFVNSFEEKDNIEVQFLNENAVPMGFEPDKKNYFLCHAGIAGFRPDKELDEYDDEDFYTFPLDFKKDFFKNKIVVVGHAPTTEFNNGQIYKTSRAINVDCGCAFDGKLGCLCLDTGREFYV